MDDYEILKFASLFHDIGKFFQRADNMGRGKASYDSKYSRLTQEDFGQNGAHSKWSADFVSKYFDNLVEELVLYHHLPEKSGDKKLCQMLQKADHHSSKERIKSVDENEVLNTPLTSIFSRISLDGKTQDDYYIPLIALDFFNKKGLHPKEVYEKEGSNLVPEYKELWSQFVGEFEKLKNKNFESSLALIKKYTSTMPSAAFKDESDISLYDHLKTTVAIANCRYLYSLESELNQSDTQDVYKVINGDISGIQNFIYKVQTPEDAQSGMSKRLRGRSLYLTMLCESIASKIIRDLNLDSSNILFCGGGRFTILAPNTTRTNDVINKINSEINKEFIDKFNAELFLNLASIDVCGNDLGKFDDVLSKLTQLLNENKKHKFLNNLEDVFDTDSDNADYKLCPVCGNPSRDKYCEDCSEHERLGGAVANAKYLIKYCSDKKINKSFFFSKLETGYIFTDKKSDVEEIINENPNIRITVFKLNDTNFLDFDIENSNVSFDFKVIGNSIPNIDNTPLYFNHLAEISKGSNKLGVLKMDVDNLGLIFSQGFKHLNNGEGGASISRISSLSFYLDLFFSGRINQIVEKFNFTTEIPKDNESRACNLDFVDDKNNIYKSKEIYRPKNPLPKGEGTSTIHINYSGGDDLLVVGPYDDIILFAQEFRKRFKKWTAENDSINISAGISIVSPKFPIGKAALKADEELEKSKDCGRDKITVFGEVLSWDTQGKFCGFNELLKFGEDLEEYYDKKYISKGFIYSLLKILQSRSDVKPLNRFDKDSWQDKNIEKTEKKRYIPMFKYKLRIIKDKDIREDLDKNGIKYMPWIKTPVSWASLRLR